MKVFNDERNPVRNDTQDSQNSFVLLKPATGETEPVRYGTPPLPELMPKNESLEKGEIVTDLEKYEGKNK